MTKLASRLLVLSLLLAPGFARAAEPVKPDAVASAKAWLALVDAGEYGPSWRQSGALFRRAVTEEQWSQALTGVRTPLGTLKSRELDTRTEATTLPGAPDGRYEVMQFRSAFAHKAAAVETVTVSLEADGRWRVIGYFIK